MDQFFLARRQDLRRRLRKSFSAALPPAAACCAALLVGHLLGVAAWTVVALTLVAGLAGGVIAVMAAAFGFEWPGLADRRRSSDLYPAGPDQTIRWAFTDEGFETRLNEYATAWPWAAVRAFLVTRSSG
jgi:hypothetical protein